MRYGTERDAVAPKNRTLSVDKRTVYWQLALPLNWSCMYVVRLNSRVTRLLEALHQQLVQAVEHIAVVRKRQCIHQGCASATIRQSGSILLTLSTLQRSDTAATRAGRQRDLDA